MCCVLHGSGAGQVFRGYYSSGSVKFKTQRKGKRRYIVREYYPGGALQLVACYNRKGELDGATREYYENGLLKAEIMYEKNLRDGYAKFYYESGTLMGKILYVDDREMGIAKFYDRNGMPVSISDLSERPLGSFGSRDTLGATPKNRAQPDTSSP